MNIPKTLLDAVRYFSDLEVCENYMREIRWAGNPPVCPHCGGMRIGEVKTRNLMRCKDCRKQFSARIGTVMEDSPLSLKAWLIIIYAFALKIKITNAVLARLLGVSSNSVWRIKRIARLVAGYMGKI